MGIKTEVSNFFDFRPKIESEEDDQIEEEIEGTIPATPQEKILSEREATDKKRLGGGCNETKFVNFKDDGSGVFKPKNGESRNLRKKIKSGTYYKRERAAYLVDRFFDFGLVPPTVIREIDGEIGSVQQFIPYANPGWIIDKSKIPEYEKQRATMWLFDCLIFNSDRHRSNYLEANGKIYAIDHGLCFGDDWLNDGDEEFYDKDLPEDIINKIKKIWQDANYQRILRELLKELLSPIEVDAFFSRLNKIARLLEKFGKIPQESYKLINQFT